MERVCHRVHARFQTSTDRLGVGGQAYGSCDGVVPPPTRESTSKAPVMQSMQAPRSVRLRLEREAEEEKRSQAAQQLAIPGASSSRSPPATIFSLSTSLGGISLDGRDARRPRRKMSIDRRPSHKSYNSLHLPKTTFTLLPRLHPSPLHCRQLQDLWIMRNRGKRVLLVNPNLGSKLDVWPELGFQHLTAKSFCICTTILPTRKNTWL